MSSVVFSYIIILLLLDDEKEAFGSVAAQPKGVPGSQFCCLG